MGDILDREAAQTVKLVGSASDGTESNPVEASDNNEIRSNDSVNVSAADTILNLTTLAQEVKVGASRNPNRKYLWMEALDKNIKWGFDSSCRFDLFKKQLIIHPVGNVPVYMKMSAGTGQAVVGEGE